MNMNCSICQKKILTHGNNAMPVNNGVCCDICNDTIVLPVREQLIKNKGYITEFGLNLKGWKCPYCPYSVTKQSSQGLAFAKSNHLRKHKSLDR